MSLVIVLQLNLNRLLSLIINMLWWNHLIWGRRWWEPDHMLFQILWARLEPNLFYLAWWVRWRILLSCITIHFIQLFSEKVTSDYNACIGCFFVSNSGLIFHWWSTTRTNFITSCPFFCFYGLIIWWTLIRTRACWASDIDSRGF